METARALFGDAHVVGLDAEIEGGPLLWTVCGGGEYEAEDCFLVAVCSTDGFTGWIKWPGKFVVNEPKLLMEFKVGGCGSK